MRIRHLRAKILTAIILIFLGNALFAGSLTNISVELTNNEAGAEAIYRFTFRTSSTGGIPDSGKVEFILPPGFDVSNVDIAQSKNLNMTGGFSVITIKEDTVRLTRDGTGNDVPGNTEVSVVIGVVVNHTSIGSYNVKINTLEVDNTAIDTGTTPNFSIVAGSLHHFQLATSGNAIAGQNFAVTITAQDEHNNTVTSFNSQVTLTDKTGTISPTTTGSFLNGVRIENLTFTKSYTDNQVTVTYNSKSGVSAFFNVLPGDLAHFKFDNISSPQTAGAAFGITITAQDQFNNTATGFIGQVTLTDNSGSLNMTSNNFVDGVLIQNVTIAKSQSDNFITAIGNGKSGISNFFNVNANNLSKFYINNVSDQIAAEWFSVMVKAQDQYDNVVTSYNTTVDISDLSNSITPNISGNFSNGSWTGSVKINSIFTNNSITINRTGGSEQGSSNNFNVSAGSLDHFTISTISSQTAGIAFSIVITAKDRENNTITSFTGSVSINDLTGTISPKVSGNFSSGSWTGNISITSALQNNQIIVIYNNKNGTSNNFNVDPNSLDHFTFSNISSPQIAGQSFSVLIVAKDQYDNKVSNFVGSVDLSDETGTLNPTSSGNFLSGEKSTNITITKKFNDNQITAMDLSTGKDGQSNKFNINAGAIHHIIVRNNPGGLGNEVGDLSLNLNNQTTMYAVGYDQWDNYIREVKADWGRTGTLDLPSPLNGTSTTFIPITPQTSGQIYADSSGMRDYTGTISVGNIHHVLIRDAAAGGGNIVNTKTITADDTLKLYAAAYDEGNNYLGPAIVDWSSSGSLQPVMSLSDMTMITFEPTTAPSSGQILADHETAIDYTTGAITVKPGAPASEIILHPDPKVIPAQSDFFSTITSDAIYDSDGNLIAEGEFFTVGTTIGTITSPVDQAPGIVGHQVKSDGSSKINFIVNADNIGGTAIIHANSVGKGSAIGNTTLLISSIHIVSITTDNEKVSQGQNDVPVRMTVNNPGSENVLVSIDGASLLFIDTNSLNCSGQYMVTRTDTFTVIPSLGGQRVFTFNVDVSTGATVDTITIDGYINGLINGKAVSDTNASQVDKWLVQTPPVLVIERVESFLDTVIQGTNTTVTATIRNDGDASAVIDTDSLIFWAQTQGIDVTHEYGQIPFLSNADTITGHKSELFSYAVQVGAAATLDTIILNAKVSGHDINTNTTYSDLNANIVDGWRVTRASEVQISEFSPSQMTVTSGQDSDWFLNMVVHNNGGTELRLDSLQIKFTIGGFDISNQYQFLVPDIFLSSGTGTLPGGNSDTLKITIDKTGIMLGTITIEGIIYLNDMISDQIIKNAYTGVIVQSAAELTIDYVRASQPEVTVSQNFPWQTIIALSNNGGSDIAIDSTQIHNFITFVGDANFVVTPPTSFYHSRNFILKAGRIDSLFFVVETTGNVPGDRQINARIISKEINSSRNITKEDNTTIKVELPAHIRIRETKNLAPNAPYVDTEQIFQIAVEVENLGEDGARDIAIYLTKDSLSTILNQVDTLSFVQGGQTDTLKFNVQAYSGWIISEVFKAEIETAFAENTPEPDKIFISSAVDSIDTVTVQRPAKMKIISVIPSQDTVRALSRDEWEIAVAVQDSGAGFIQLNQPSANDISISIEGNLQEDYTIIPPKTLKNSQDLMLAWGEEDLLIYRVISTGIMSGSGKIRVDLDGTYLNTATQFQVSDSAGIYIQPSADVYVDITEPICPNINQYGIGQVNTNQKFNVKSKIRNSGGERVDNVVVSLSAMGYAIKPDTIEYIPQSGNAWAYFNVTAQQTAANRVNFIAKIDTAISHQSGLPALIGPASDSIASVRVHKPALLQISINKADSIFTAGKLGMLRVKVANLGTAEVDSSGEIYIKTPAGYHVLVDDQLKASDTTGFIVNQQISWQVSPPLYSSSKDTIIVAINKPPEDRNTELFASIANADPFDSLIVKTIPSVLSINSFVITAPAGAIDDTLSTFQDFLVNLDINASENIDTIRATLILPEGYVFVNGMADSVKYVVNNQASWKLKASESDHSISKWIKIRVAGDTGYGIETARDSIAVVTKKRAFLSFKRVEISSQTDSVLSVGQEFDFRVTIINNGDANIEGAAYLKLDFGATGITAIEQDTIKPFSTDTPVTWKLKAPDEVTTGAPIIVAFHTIPKDENTNEPVMVQNNSYYFWVETQLSGNASIDSLWITSPSGALDKVLSTYQTFSLEADVWWQNCRDVSITLQLEGGFKTAESNPKIPSGTGQQGRVSWAIVAPEASKDDQYVWLTLSAQDINSGRNFTVTSDSLKINVVNRSEIQLNAKIIAPNSAMDGVVSTGQEFIVAAFISNFGEAKLTGNYTATITLPEGQDYTLNEYQTLTTSHNDTLFWTIQAPLYEREAKNIKVELISAPKDENTNLPVVAEAILLKNDSFPIQTEEKAVIIADFLPRDKRTITRGAASISMLGLELICSGNANSNNILLSGVKIKLKDRFGNLITDPRKAISKVSIVNYDEGSFIYGQLIDIPSTNPIEIIFNKIDTLKPEQPNKIAFKVDVSANTEISDFQLAIDSTNALYLIDAESKKVPSIKDKNGQKLEVLNIESGPSIIIDADFDKAFFNFPNPFGVPSRPETYFVYYLDQDTNVEIKIYTLIGELVWSRSYSASDPQGKKGSHEADIIWDGRNDKGYCVLNGLYIARIATGYGKTSLTKIAIIK